MTTTFPVVVIDSSLILSAIELQLRHRLSFWDGLILAAARSAGASVLFSEDFSHGTVYDGVRIVSPFRQ